MKNALFAATAVIALSVAGPAFADESNSVFGEVSWAGNGVTAAADADQGASSYANGDLTGAWTNTHTGTEASGDVLDFGRFGTYRDADATAAFNGRAGSAAVDADAGLFGSVSHVNGAAATAGDADVETGKIYGAYGLGEKPKGGHVVPMQHEGAVSGAHGLFRAGAAGATGLGVSVSKTSGVTDNTNYGYADTGLFSRGNPEAAGFDSMSRANASNKTAGLGYSVSESVAESNSGGTATIFGNEAY